MTTRRQLEEDVVSYSRRLHARGWVANHDGNVTARLRDGRLVATPTGISKGDVERGWLIVVDADGKVVSGSRKVFSEISLHLYVYLHRPDVRAVLHSHSPAATALAVAGQPVLSTILPESVVSIGDRIPMIPYASPKSPDARLNFAPWVDDVDAVTIEQHGVMTWGPDLETAFLRMELVEHLARIQLKAMPLGKVREIPQEDIASLLEARAKAGLGRVGRERRRRSGRITGEVSKAVREEVVRAVRSR